jgi:muramoyltetrapeptide carboxypeptidase LdcA involved in peptidoglycan recycling
MTSTRGHCGPRSSRAGRLRSPTPGIIRALGERGILKAADAVLVARPPVSDFTRRPPAAERARLRAEQRDIVVELIGRYNPEAVVCVGIPFGHTRPQWIIRHGGTITVDGTAQQVVADYS